MLIVGVVARVAVCATPARVKARFVYGKRKLRNDLHLVKIDTSRMDNSGGVAFLMTKR